MTTATIQDSKILNSICDVLERLCKKIFIVAEIPLIEKDYRGSVICLIIIDANKFLPCKEIQGKLNHEKFQKTCAEIQEKLTALILELQMQSSYRLLINFVDDCAGKYLKTNFTLENYHKQKKTKDDVDVGDLLKQECVEQIRKHVEHEDDTERILFEWKFAYSQNKYHAKMEMQFQTAWIKSHVDQNYLWLKRIETRTRKMMSEFKTSREYERRILQRIKAFYAKKIEELQEEVKRMSAKYD